MNEVEEMFKKTSHSAKVFAMWVDPEAKAGTKEAFPWFAFAHTREREGAPRKPGKDGKPQKPYRRREGVSAPGGTVESADYTAPPTDTTKLVNYAFRNAAKRELRNEVGIVRPIDDFSEKWSIHVPAIESDHVGSDYLETHYYLITVEAMIQNVPIIETDEVIELIWYRSDNIPLPNPKKEGRMASFQKHIQNLYLFLQKLETRYEDADLWRRDFEERFGSYLY